LRGSTGEGAARVKGCFGDDRRIIPAPGTPEKMIKRRVRLRITVASRRVARHGGPGFSAPCPACGRQVEALTRREAASTLEVDEPALECLVPAGKVHAIPMVGGALRVCKDSLFKV
jgi:hypothetical protein